MKTYTVKEISEMLNTNPETVRRWIRNKKLDATIASKKGGHVVYEPALREFLKSFPKYAAIATATMQGAGVLPTVMVGRLIALTLIDSEKLNEAWITTRDVVFYLQGEIKKCQESIKSSETTIAQLQKQIETDEAQIIEYQRLIESLKSKKEDANE